MDAKLLIFMHVARMGDWESILFEQWGRMMSSGLVDASWLVTLGVVGEGKPIPLQHPKLNTVFCGDNLRLFEFPTLDLLYRACLYDSRCFVCYSHLKGVSVPTEGHRQWRREISHFVIDRWEDRVHELENRYTSGARYRRGGCGWNGEYASVPGHYSGNFWWARGDYCCKLQSPMSLLSRNRYWAEAWIAQLPSFNQLLSYCPLPQKALV